MLLASPRAVQWLQKLIPDWSVFSKLVGGSQVVRLCVGNVGLESVGIGIGVGEWVPWAYTDYRSATLYGLQWTVCCSPAIPSSFWSLWSLAAPDAAKRRTISQQMVKRDFARWARKRLFGGPAEMGWETGRVSEGPVCYNAEARPVRLTPFPPPGPPLGPLGCPGCPGTPVKCLTLNLKSTIDFIWILTELNQTGVQIFLRLFRLPSSGFLK